MCWDVVPTVTTRVRLAAVAAVVMAGFEAMMGAWHAIRMKWIEGAMIARPCFIGETKMNKQPKKIHAVCTSTEINSGC